MTDRVSFHSADVSAPDAPAPPSAAVHGTDAADAPRRRAWPWMLVLVAAGLSWAAFAPPLAPRTGGEVEPVED